MIKNFLPQREPFLFIDELVDAPDGELAAYKNYEQDFVFAQQGADGLSYVPPLLLLEALVQCGGAGIKKAGLGKSGIFVLAAIDKARIRGRVAIPSRVEFTVATDKAAGRVLRQRGSAHAGGRFVLNARWTCVFVPD